MRVLLIGVLMISALSACSNSTASMPRPTNAPVPVTATPERSSTIAAEESGSFEYSSVAEALADLKTRDDVLIEILQGWTIIKEADGLTNWSFAPLNHPAYPALAKRVLYRDQQGWQLKMDILCEAATAACDQFVRYFESINQPLYHMIQQQQKP